MREGVVGPGDAIPGEGNPRPHSWRNTPWRSANSLRPLRPLREALLSFVLDRLDPPSLEVRVALEKLDPRCATFGESRLLARLRLRQTKNPHPSGNPRSHYWRNTPWPSANSLRPLRPLREALLSFLLNRRDPPGFERSAGLGENLPRIVRLSRVKASHELRLAKALRTP